MANVEIIGGVKPLKLFNHILTIINHHYPLIETSKQTIRRIAVRTGGRHGGLPQLGAESLHEVPCCPGLETPRHNGGSFERFT